MAWDEWEQLKADALERQTSHMRLNSAGGGGAGGPDDLKISNSLKERAAKALQDEIRPSTDKAGGMAEESSAAAVREFSCWETGSGLKDASDEWELQVNSLKRQLVEDQIALQQTKRDFKNTDHGVKSQLAQITTPGPDDRRAG
ncbi:hypothetical protein ACIBCO_38405 [Streptomyces violascens]|uniref:hypothetical protein n=1 Tax=Streptomyces violascens TaxID=67381 RepID=UPI00378F469D